MIRPACVPEHYLEADGCADAGGTLAATSRFGTRPTFSRLTSRRAFPSMIETSAFGLQSTLAPRGIHGRDAWRVKCLLLPAKLLDLTAAQVPNIIVRTSILWRSDRPGQNPGYTDGAKIYLCYRRSCFLTGKRRRSLLDRLPPRKPRFPSHTSKMRSVLERRSGHDEPVSAWRSVCDRRRRGNGP